MIERDTYNYQTSTTSQITKGTPPSHTITIALDIVLNGIILLHAHTQVVRGELYSLLDRWRDMVIPFSHLLGGEKIEIRSHDGC